MASISLENIENGRFRIVMDRRGLSRLVAILAGRDEDGRVTLHDKLHEVMKEARIDADLWEGKTHE